MEEDPQLANPLKRPIILALYKAVREMYPEANIPYSEHYDAEIEKETSS